MDPDRARIHADLSGLLGGQIRCDPAFLQIYASDASIYETVPLGVVRPAGVEDVVACVNYARENELSVIPRGAGSNVTGGVVGRGLVLDFSHAMRRIKSFGREQVTVQPGVVLRHLNRHLTAHRQHFGPDPATRAVTTMGGVLATNSTGSRWNRYGSPRDHVARLQVVLASGEVVEIDESTPVANNNPVAKRLHRDVQSIVERNGDLIEKHRPRTRINQAGYNLFDLNCSASHQTGATDPAIPQLDLNRLLVGSEGTLGIITEATLHTDPLPTHRGVALLFFQRVAAAAQAALEIAEMNPAACDMVDRRLLSIAREKDASYHKVLPAEAESMLLVEFQTNDAAKLEHKLESLVRQVQRRSQLAFDVRTTTDPRERDFFWHLVRRIVPIQYRLGGQRRAIPFVEDIAIEPTLLPEFLQHLHGILNRHEVTASVFAHMPQGHLHVRPLINMADPTVLPKLQRLATELFDYVVSLGGTISGGLGDGLSRTWYLRQQYGPLYRVMAEVKDVFDPQNVLNPGKVINHPAHGVTDDVRSVTVAPSLFRTAQSADAASNKPSSNVGAASTPGKLNANSNVGSSVSGNGLDNGSPESQPLPIVPTELTWDLEQTAAAAQACNGCGRCRTLSPSERMCPVFRMSPREESSPRSKANLMRGIVTGQLDPKLLATKEFRTIADLCVNCHQCRLDCPASVDVPKLMVEAKAQHYLTNGVAISDWVLTRLDWLYGIAGRMPRITNRMIRNRFARWILDRLFGIAEGRKLPPFAASPFSRWASRQKLTGTKVAGDSKAAKVVYFVDAYANWNDVELAQAFVEVLRHNQVQVAIPPDQLVSGMSLISDGAITRARKIAQANVELLAEWVRDGYRVVTTEPSAALALSHEYLNLLDDEDARLVADNTIDGMNFLLELHRRDELSLDFQPVQATIGYHLPCHQRALAQTVPAVELLRLIPGLNVEVFDKGCSGMAGTFGLKRKNYLTSLRMGFGLIDAVRQDHLIAATTECSTCKIQMEQGTEKPTVHPIKIMAMAYGAMSDLDDILERRSGTLVTT